MRRALSLLRMAVALSLILPASCATSPAGSPEGVEPRAEPKLVRVRELPGEQLKLFFEPLAPDPALEVLELEQARGVLAAFHESFPPERGSRLRLVLASTSPMATREGIPTEWERRLKGDFLSRYGPPLLPMPESLETSPLYLALSLSPRYMGPGVREAAQELFSSRTFLVSVVLSVVVYFAAWLAPEPFFSKAFAATLTVRLALAVGLLELNNVAQACLRLYREASAARTVAELEAVAERFGKAMGGTALRVLVLAASFGVGKGLPQVPEGGIWKLLGLGSPRYAMPGGISPPLGSMTSGGTMTAQVAADGTLLVTGTAIGTAASALRSACGDGSTKKDGHQWHHLATDKNDSSTVQGGPWTPLFKVLFDQAGMSLNALENLVYLENHKGPHPEEYHAEVYRRLKAALEDCETVVQCKSRLVDELKKLADEVCTPGSTLHRLATKR